MYACFLTFGIYALQDQNSIRVNPESNKRLDGMLFHKQLETSTGQSFTQLSEAICHMSSLRRGAEKRQIP